MIKYKTCKGKNPKCSLGKQNHKLVVEIQGADLSSIYFAQKDSTIPRGLNKVFDKEYDIVIVGAYPHYKDSVECYPFVNCPKLVDVILKAGIDLERVYATTIVKCIPPFRQPSVQEINICTDHLTFELQKIKPKVVILMGNTALRAFNLHNEGGINKIRGTIIKKKYPPWEDGPEFTIIPTFDPAMFLRKHDPTAERKFQDDIILAKAVLDGDPPKNQVISPKYQVIKTVDQLEDMVSQIKEAKFVAFDTETRGLPWNKEPLICFSFCWGYDEKTGQAKGAVLPIRQHSPIKNGEWNLTPFWGTHPKRQIKTKEIFKLLNDEIFSNTEVVAAAHNAKFDFLVLRYWAGIENKGLFHDSILMHHLLCEIPPHDLEYVARVELGLPNYSKAITRVVGKGKVLRNPYDMIPDHNLWKYAFMDALSCFRLIHLFLSRLKLKEKLLKLYYEIPLPLSKELMEAEWTGIRIDLDLLDKIGKRCEQKREDLLKEIKKITNPQFNPMSPIQVRNAIIEAGFEDSIKERRKANGYDTSKERLARFKDDLHLCGMILDYRVIRKLGSTYVANIKNNSENSHDGRVRYSWLIHGPETGRLSCAILHNVPRVDENEELNFRNAFIVDPKNLLGYLDFSQIELRVFAYRIAKLTGDTAMFDLFKKGANLHRETAALILDIVPERVSKFNYSLGKTVNFGIVYGSEGHQLMKQSYEDEYGVKRPLTREMFELGWSNYKETFPGVFLYKDILCDEARMNGGTYITEFGRERRMGFTLNNADTLAAAERELVNFSISSPAQEITSGTIVRIGKQSRELMEKGLLKPKAVRMNNTVHDSIAYEIFKNLKDWFREGATKIATRPILELANHSFPCAIGFGKSWAEAEKNAS